MLAKSEEKVLIRLGFFGGLFGEVWKGLRGRDSGFLFLGVKGIFFVLFCNSLETKQSSYHK